MAEKIRTKVRRARKNYHCDAWPFIDAQREKNDGYKCHQIENGQLYQLDVVADAGGLSEFRLCIQCRDYATQHKIKMEENCY